MSNCACQLLCVCKHRRVNEELRGYLTTGIISRLSWEKFSPVCWRRNGFTPRYVHCGIDFKEWRYSPPSAERSRPMSFKRKWIVLVREIRLLFTLRFLLFRVKSRPLSRLEKILERILISPFFLFLSSKFSPLNIRQTLSSSRTCVHGIIIRSKCNARALSVGKVEVDNSSTNRS